MPKKRRTDSAYVEGQLEFTMEKTIGAMAALTMLTLLIVGPVYFAISNSHDYSDGGRCSIGEIGCETNNLRHFHG